MYHFGEGSTRGDKVAKVWYSFYMKFMGAHISTVPYPELLRDIERALSEKKSIFITTPNPEMLLAGLKNSSLQDLLGRADFGVVDGFGLQLLLMVKGIRTSRITGVELLQNLVRDLSTPVIFIGNEQVVVAAQQFLPRSIISIVAPHLTTDEEIRTYARLINSKLPLGCAVFVGLGMGKQELLAHELLQGNAAVALGVGGAFDMIAGVLPRAPQIFQGLGLEWVWRLWLQPSRFSRIVKAVIVFPCKALFYPVSYE